jgi:hypothetical protein
LVSGHTIIGAIGCHLADIFVDLLP